MMIPVFSEVQFVRENGFLTSEMQLFLDQLIQALQGALSDNGWTIPPISAANLVLLEANKPMPNGTIWYESTANEWVGKQNGSLVKFTTTPYP